MKLIILTPEKQILEIEVNEVTVPTLNGEVTILPGHADLVAQLGLGNIYYKDSFISIESGVLETDGKTVKILADTAIHSADYQDEQIELIKKNAEELIKNAPKDANLEKLKSQVRVAKLHLVSKKRKKI